LEAGRPVEVHIPPSYDPEVALPLVLFLHGGLSFHCSVVDSNNIDMGAWTEASRDFRGLANERGFLYAHPNAPIYPFGAGDSCAIIWNGARPRFSTEDDSAYLRGVIEEIQGKLTVDPGRVFMIGRSNGGSMVHRMACDHPDLLAAVVSIAGATYMDPGDCAPSAPVHVLQIHGTDDRTVFYRGDKTYPGAVATVEQWAMHNDCVVEPEELPPLDLEIHIDQADGNPAETVVTRYAAQCNAGGSAELWTIPGGTHVPGLIDPWVEPFPRRRPNPAFSEAVIDWLFGHSKPLEASFTVTPERGLRPLEVTVDASAFAATLQGSASYEWDFGDGTTDEGAQVEHTYTNVGRFPIQLTVTDSEGRMFRATGRVNVRLASEPVDPWKAGDIGAVTAHGGVGFEES
jgi:polyhydroxybutyrate depolymerase